MKSNEQRDGKNISSGINLFDCWRQLFFWCLIVIGLFYFLRFSGSLLLLLVLGAAFLIFLINYMMFYTKIEKNGSTISFSTLGEEVILTHCTDVVTWWSYDFNSGSPSLTEGTQGKSVPRSNKINVFAEFYSEIEEASVICYEQIHMSEKFPNNHNYDNTIVVDLDTAFKVWDIDNCLSSLRIA